MRWQELLTRLELRLSKRPSILFFALATALVPCAGCFHSPDSPSALAQSASNRCLAPADSEDLADRVVQLVNLERAENGLPPVIASPALSKIAESFACRMIEEGFFGHRDPESGDGPGDRAESAKYTFFAVGENLAVGSEDPADVMRLWMESPAHRENILDPRWTEVGVAVRAGGQLAMYWVQEFGQPPSSEVELSNDAGADADLLAADSEAVFELEAAEPSP